MNLEEITKLTGGPIISANKNNSKNSNFILFTFITIAGIYIWNTYNNQKKIIELLDKNFDDTLK
jgi:hypothetical protein